MKKVLITGKNSYVGVKLNRWLLQFPNEYTVDSISVRNEEWNDKDFSKYDVVVHVAGIAHIKETKENAPLYYRVNRDLAYDVAKKVKSSGVKQFVFLSSMSVYGVESGLIDKKTPLNPKNNYGKSKLEAEELISSLADTDYKIAIIRPPMIYGESCKGNYMKLSKLAISIPCFPKIENKRSMIYVDHLSEFMKLLIDNCESGVFHPQNMEYVKTSELVKEIANFHGKKIVLTKLFNPILRAIMYGALKKMFGNLVYDKELSRYKANYCMESFRDTITLTEGGDKENEIDSI